MYIIIPRHFILPLPEINAVTLIDVWLTWLSCDLYEYSIDKHEKQPQAFTKYKGEKYIPYCEHWLSWTTRVQLPTKNYIWITSIIAIGVNLTFIALELGKILILLFFIIFL